jgi:hypothetical protein
MVTADQLSRDFRIFADLATNFFSKHSKDSLHIQMVRDGGEREYLIDLVSGSVTCRHDSNRKYLSVQALLATEEFADLRTLRATQRRLMLSAQQAPKLDPEGVLIEANGTSSPLTISSFRSVFSTQSSEALSVLLLDGAAGIGKTFLIERMVYERSDPAAADPPVLHVTSSGSRLTDLNKALAHASQALRSRITFDQVPILVRHGVLQVAIDGFDELVDPEGYKDAWSALRAFLGEVGIGGPVILSGRDTFFDQQSFERKLADRITNLQLTNARLQPVSPSTAKRYLVANGWSESDVSAAEEGGWLQPGSYHLRPFFLHQISGVGGWGGLRDAFGSPQAFLVRRFVGREANLVSKMVEIAPQVAESALWEFYGLVVEDMALQEVDVTDESFLALACETAFESYLPKDDLKKLMHKAGSLGLLESDRAGSGRKFPHSELQNQFLARVVVNSLAEAKGSSAYLRRGVVGMGLLEAFSDAFGQSTEARGKEIVGRLHSYIQQDNLSERLAANAAALLLVTLSHANFVERTNISSLDLNDVRLVGLSEAAELRDVNIVHLDLRGGDCHAIDFVNCSVNILTADKSTVLGTNQPRIQESLQEDIEGVVSIVRIPDKIQQWLVEHTVQQSEEEVRELPLVRYFDRLCRKFIRQHQIRATSTDEAYFLLQDRFWEEVRTILGNRIQEGTRVASGPRSGFFRMINPQGLLAPERDDRESQSLRRKIVQRARELG